MKRHTYEFTTRWRGANYCKLCRCVKRFWWDQLLTTYMSITVHFLPRYEILSNCIASLDLHWENIRLPSCFWTSQGMGSIQPLLHTIVDHDFDPTTLKTKHGKKHVKTHVNIASVSLETLTSTFSGTTPSGRDGTLVWRSHVRQVILSSICCRWTRWECNWQEAIAWHGWNDWLRRVG